MRLVIVGYGPGGAAAAITARTFSPKSEIAIVTMETHDAHRKPGASMALEFPDTDELTISDWTFDALSEKNIAVLSGSRVVLGDPEKKVIDIVDSKGKQSTLEYDKLILATGALPSIPDVPGRDLPGVFTIQDMADTSRIGMQLSSLERIVIVGAGFSGLETAERLLKMGKEVHMVIRSRFMRRQLEEPMSKDLASRMPSYLHLHFGQTPTAVIGENKVKGLQLGEETLAADAVLFMTGVKPDVRLAKALGVNIGTLGGITVNKSMQTSVPDIYAVGDCVELNDSLTGKPTLFPVGSAAARAGRQAGVAVTGSSKIYDDNAMRLQYDRLFDTDIVCIGHSSTSAKQLGVNCTVEYFEDPKEFESAALVIDETGKLIGGQVIASRMGARLGYEILDRVEKGASLKDQPLLKPRHERLKEHLESKFGPIRS